MFLLLLPRSNHFAHKRPYLVMLSQLIITLVFDLGLNRPSGEDTPVFNFMNTGYPKTCEVGTERTTGGTMEEKRAVLGCFIISSVYVALDPRTVSPLMNVRISAHLQKMDPMRWTPYLTECLQILDERKEVPSDALLVQQVRIRLVNENVNQCLWPAGGMAHEDIPTTPWTFYLKAFQSQLQVVKDKIPPSLLSHSQADRLRVG